MSKFNAREYFANGPSVTIFSVFPIEMRAQRTFNGLTDYILPAARDGEITSCVVKNGFQLQQIGDDKIIDQPIFAPAIARDILREWTLCVIGVEGDATPGVWIGSGSEPTDEEIEAAKAKQWAYFQNLFNTANEYFEHGDLRSISALHRTAAIELGHGDAEWVNLTSITPQKDCPSCYAKIDARATRCRHCGADVPLAPLFETDGVKRMAKNRK